MTENDTQHGGAVRYLRHWPIPIVALSVGCSMMIFGAGITARAQWNALALILGGALLAALGILGQQLRVREAAEADQQ